MAINHILIIAGAPIENMRWLSDFSETADMIICADGGLTHANKAVIIPDHLVGDFDSLTEEELNAANEDPDITVHYAGDQNSTDFQKALALTSAYPEARITIVGALGGRLDHQLSNMLCLERYSHHDRIVLRDENTSVRLVSKSLTLNGKADDIVGVVPLRDTQNLRYEGLKYEASALGPPYTLGWLGTSNSMLGDTATIHFDSGSVLVIHIEI